MLWLSEAKTSYIPFSWETELERSIKQVLEKDLDPKNLQYTSILSKINMLFEMIRYIGMLTAK